MFTLRTKEIWPADALLEIPFLQKLLLSNRTDGVWYCLQHNTWVVSLVRPDAQLTFDLFGTPASNTCWGHTQGYRTIFLRQADFRIQDWETPDGRILAQILEDEKKQESKD